MGSAGLGRRLGDHRLQGLPRHVERRRDVPRPTSTSGTGYVDTSVSTARSTTTGLRRERRWARACFRTSFRCKPSVPATVPGEPILNPPIPGDNSVTLTWIALGSGGSPITGFKIYRGTSSGAETPGDGRRRQHVHRSTAANGVTYFYVVSAVNAIGEGRSRTSARRSRCRPGAPTLASAVAAMRRRADAGRSRPRTAARRSWLQRLSQHRRRSRDGSRARRPA